ncbi:MAG: EpsG family protein [Marinifilaceae bacterium]
MLFSYIIYFILIIVIYATSQYTYKRNGRDTYLINQEVTYTICIIFSLIIGCRYMVGIDYPVYLQEYNNAQWGCDYMFDFEIIPKYTMLFLSQNHIHFSIWFVLMAFLTIFFFIKSFDEKIIDLLPISLLFLCLIHLAFINNVVRQSVALTIIMCAVRYIRSHNLFKYIMLIFLAYGFHTSALIFLPMYWVVRLKILSNRIFQLIIFAISVVFSDRIVPLLIEMSSGYLGYIGYENRLERFDIDDTLMIEFSSGIGYYVKLILAFFIIIFTPILNRAFVDRDFMYFNRLYFIGICLYTITANFMLLGRMALYFDIFYVIMLAFLVKYLQSLSRCKTIGYIVSIIIILFYISTFMLGIYKGGSLAPFNFI